MKTANVRNTMDNPCADASGGGASGGGAATAAAAIGVCVYTHTYADDFFLGGGGMKTTLQVQAVNHAAGHTMAQWWCVPRGCRRE